MASAARRGEGVEEEEEGVMAATADVWKQVASERNRGKRAGGQREGGVDTRESFYVSIREAAINF